MAEIVVLNLADPGGIGPVSRVKKGLEEKTKDISGVIVKSYDLFDYLNAIKDKTKISNDPEVQKIATSCANSRKIYLCTHGTAKDTNHAFAKASGGDALGRWKDVGRLLAALFKDQRKEYNVALVMCYGARTTTFRARDLDHNGMIHRDLIKTSFAYKLFKYLCQKSRKVRMTARTGAVAFDDKTGKSSVEQELAIDIALDQEEYLRSPKIQSIIDKWRADRDAVGSDDEKAQAFIKADEKFKSNPNARAALFSKLEKHGKAYHKVIAQKNAYQDMKWQYADLEKYGKIVYTWDAGDLTVVNKYGSATTGLEPDTVLYCGPFV